MPPNCRVVDVSAWLNGWKRRAAWVGGQAAPGVDNVERHSRRVRASEEAALQLHAAGFRKLDGIAQKVDQNLSQA